VEILRAGGLRAISTQRTERPMDDFAEAGSRWLANVHVDVFPNGTGYCPAGMPLETYLRYLAQRHPSKQHANAGLLMSGYDILRRHKVLLDARLQLRLTPSAVQQVVRLTPTEVVQVEELARRALQPVPQLRRDLRQLTPDQAALYRAYRKTTAHIHGSPQSMQALRSQMFSLWCQRCMWTMAININPAAALCRLTFCMAGAKYELDASGTPIAWPSRAERYRVLQANPLACAHFLNNVWHVFCEQLLHWDFEHQCQRTDMGPCLFGEVSMVAFKPETNKRDELHTHGQIAQPALQPEHLLRVLRDPTTQASLLRWMEQVQCQFLPAPFCAAGISVDADGPAGEAPVQLAMVDSRDRRNAAVPPVACEVPLPPLASGAQLSGEQRRALDEYLARCALYCQVHVHTSTCRQGGHAGTDADCRMMYPRATLQRSTFTGNHVLLKRAGGRLVSYCPTEMLWLPCNHTFSFHCEASRSLAQITLAQAAQRSNPDAPAPVQAAIAEQAADSADYATKYMTKVDSDCSNAAVGQLFEVSRMMGLQACCHARRHMLLRLLRDTAAAAAASAGSLRVHAAGQHAAHASADSVLAASSALARSSQLAQR
jgi:hypothetical protein